jgi:hypothetical protein
MSQAVDFYVELVEQFLSGILPLQQFQEAYFARFQDEAGEMEEPLFQLLDELFGDLDSFTDDPVLLAAEPGFYLDESALRGKVRDIFARMQVWRAHRQGTPRALGAPL